MKFTQLKNSNFINISCIIATLDGIFDLSYLFNIDDNDIIQSQISALINLFGIIAGFIGFLINRHHQKRLSYKMGIKLNLLLVFAKFFIYPIIHNFLGIMHIYFNNL